MAIKFKLVKDDTRPDIYLFLTDKATGLPIDLSALTTVIRMYMRKVGSTELKDILTLAKLPGTISAIDEDTGAQTVKLGAPYTLDGQGGRCALQWGPTSLDTAGLYEGEVEITFADGGRQTWYETMQFAIREDFNTPG